MENATVTNPTIKDCQFETLLQQFAEPYVQCIARKYSRKVVGMEYEDLCQDGRMKCWKDYGHFIQSRPEMPVVEFIKLFKYDMTCRCLDQYRKVFSSEKRSAYKIIDLDSMMQSLESEQNSNLIEIFADKRSSFGVIDLETRDLVDYIKQQLSNLEIRILDELINPSDRLTRVMVAETLPIENRNRLLNAKDPALVILNRDCPNPRQRMTSKTPLWHISVSLGNSYNEVRSAFDHLKAVVATVLFEETEGALTI